MKILFLTRRFWPNVGGVEKHVFEISKRLIEMGNEVTVITEDDESKNDDGFARSLLADRSSTLGLLGETFRTIRIPAVGKNEKLKKFKIWRWLWKHRKLIREADIVHAHDVGFWYWPFRLLYFKKPFFITFHGWEEIYPIPFKNKFFRKINEKLAWGNICVGEYLTKYYGTKANYITYGGTETDEAGNSRDLRRLIPGIKTRILYAGRLDTEEIFGYLEGVRILKDDGSFARSLLAETPFRLRTARRRGETFSTTTMVVLGDGKRRKEAEEYARKYRLPVTFMGEMGDVGKLGELEKANVIFTNGYLSILEGLAAGKPVFSLYTNPVKKDYLCRTPFREFINICGGPEELAEGIKGFEGNEGEKVKKGYKWVKGQTWEKVTEAYLKLWEKFL